MPNVNTFSDYKSSIFYFNRFDDLQEFMSEGKQYFEEAMRKYNQ